MEDVHVHVHAHGIIPRVQSECLFLVLASNHKAGRLRVVSVRYKRARESKHRDGSDLHVRVLLRELLLRECHEAVLLFGGIEILDNSLVQ